MEYLYQRIYEIMKSRRRHLTVMDAYASTPVRA